MSMPKWSKEVMNRQRVILHCDCNSFFASVEAIDHPEYKKVPMAVGGDPEARHGIILAKNELAKAYKIQTAETLWQAKRKCPQLLIVPAHHEKYEQVSKAINNIYQQYTDRVEPFSVDESWLDVTGSQHLLGTGKEIADELRKRIREEIGVTISAGVSFNKTFAKLGSDYKKPDATTVITPDNFKTILWPLPIEDMLFVGKATAELLRIWHITTIGELAQTPKEKIEKILGKNGIGIWEQANGIDDSEVALSTYEYVPKSVSRMETYDHDLFDSEEIKTGLLNLSDDVAGTLRKQKRYAGVITIQIKDTKMKVLQRQKKLTRKTDLAKEIYNIAWQLVDQNWNRSSGIRMLTVGLSDLSYSDEQQLDLFVNEQHDQQTEDLEHTFDTIRQRFGDSAVKYARSQKIKKKEE